MQLISSDYWNVFFFVLLFFGCQQAKPPEPVEIMVPNSVTGPAIKLPEPNSLIATVQKSGSVVFVYVDEQKNRITYPSVKADSARLSAALGKIISEHGPGLKERVYIVGVAKETKAFKALLGAFRAHEMYRFKLITEKI